MTETVCCKPSSRGDHRLDHHPTERRLLQPERTVNPAVTIS